MEIFNIIIHVYLQFSDDLCYIDSVDFQNPEIFIFLEKVLHQPETVPFK